jgi:hypothetical protein
MASGDNMSSREVLGLVLVIAGLAIAPLGFFMAPGYWLVTAAAIVATLTTTTPVQATPMETEAVRLRNSPIALASSGANWPRR